MTETIICALITGGMTLLGVLIANGRTQAVTEAKLDELKAELLKPEYQSSYSKLTEIQNEIDAMEEAIMEDMENWEQLSSQLEELLQSEG